MFTPKRIIDWANLQRDLLRQGDLETLDRFLECFWESQIKSKVALINALGSLDLIYCGPAYIFGGWYGVLACMLSDHFTGLNKVYSIDIDRKCSTLGPSVTGYDPKVKFWTMNMGEFGRFNYFYPDVIINTSTEHVDQDTFDRWLKDIPSNVPVVLQGNNYFECSEHVRCSVDMAEFKKQNPLSNIIYETEIDCGTFTRFMTIGYR